MSGLRRDGAIARFAAVFTVVVILLGAGASEASGVVGGKAVSITAAPWTVLVQEYGYPICTGVIIDSSQILTAGHCVTSDNGESAEPSPASDFTVEAGISNYKQPLKSDHQQSRSVSAVRVMPGYVAASKLTSANYLDTVDHDLAVLTLSEPLDLDGDDARVAYLPSASTPMPGRVSRLVLAGFGNEKPSTYAKSAGDWTGQLNEVVNRRSAGAAALATSCASSSRRALHAGETAAQVPSSRGHARSSSGSLAKASHLAGPGRTTTLFLPRGQRCVSFTPACGVRTSTAYRMALPMPTQLSGRFRQSGLSA